MDSEYQDEFASGRHFARRTESRPDTRVLDCDLRHITSRPGAVVYVHTSRNVASKRPPRSSWLPQQILCLSPFHRSVHWQSPQSSASS